MRVVHVTPFHEHAVAMGGVAVGTGSLARAQVRAGADVTVFTTDVGLGKGTAVPGQAAGVNYRCFHVRKGVPFFFSGQMIHALANHISDFDIVHIHGLWNVPVNCAAMLAVHAGLPFVLSPRGMLNQWAFRFRYWKKFPAWCLFQHRIVRKAAFLMYSSDEERQQSQALVNHRRTAVVPFGVEGLHANFEDVPRGSFRVRLGMDRDTPLLAFVGRIHPIKGLGVLLQAVRRAAENISGLQIVIAGPDDGGHQVQLQQQAIKLGIAERVHWVGVVAGREKRALLQDADLFMFVSFSENFGLAAVEAMAARTPVVLGEGVNIATLVRKYDAGWVVPTEAVAVADAIREALCNPALRRARAQRASKVVAEQFDPDVIARKSLAVYRDCLEQVAGAGPQGARLSPYKKQES